MTTPEPDRPAWGQPQPPNQPPGPPGAPEWRTPAEPPKKGGAGKKVGLGCLGVLGAIILIGAIGAAMDKKPSGTTTAAVSATPAATKAPAAPTSAAASQPPAPAASSAPAAPPEPAKPPAGTFSGDGTYLVGSDIQPGTYKTAGPGTMGCYWERDKDASGGFGSIIANDNLTGQGVVTIAPTDKVFKTIGCKDWVKVD